MLVAKDVFRKVCATILDGHVRAVHGAEPDNCPITFRELHCSLNLLNVTLHDAETKTELPSFLVFSNVFREIVYISNEPIPFTRPADMLVSSLRATINIDAETYHRQRVKEPVNF